MEWKTGNVLTPQLNTCPVSGETSGTSYSQHSLSRSRVDQSASKLPETFQTHPQGLAHKRKGMKLGESGWVSDHLASNGCQTSHIAPKFLHGHNKRRAASNDRTHVPNFMTNCHLRYARTMVLTAYLPYAIKKLKYDENAKFWNYICERLGRNTLQLRNQTTSHILYTGSLFYLATTGYDFLSVYHMPS